MKIILLFIILAVVIYPIFKAFNKSDKDIIEILKHNTLFKVSILLSLIWFIFAFAMIDPFNRVSAWDNLLIVGILPIVLINGILLIFRNHNEKT